MTYKVGDKVRHKETGVVLWVGSTSIDLTTGEKWVTLDDRVWARGHFKEADFLAIFEVVEEVNQ